MKAPNGKPYTAPSGMSELAKTQKAVDVLARRKVATPKPVAAQPGAAGPFGQTMAIPTNVVTIDTGGTLSVSSWSFSSETGGTPPTLTAPAGSMAPNSFGFSDDGWYRAHILLSIGWASGAPGYVRVTAGRAAKGFTSAQFSYEVPCVAGDASGLHAPGVTGAFVSLSVPEQFYTAADHCMTILVRWGNSNTPTAASGSGVPTSRLDVTRVG